MTTRRWTDAETTWFAISGVGPELAAPAERVLMDYQRNGDEWRRGYPANTPGLDDRLCRPLTRCPLTRIRCLRGKRDRSVLQLPGEEKAAVAGPCTSTRAGSAGQDLEAAGWRDTPGRRRLRTAGPGKALPARLALVRRNLFPLRGACQLVSGCRADRPAGTASCLQAPRRPDAAVSPRRHSRCMDNRHAPGPATAPRLASTNRRNRIAGPPGHPDRGRR